MTAGASTPTPAWRVAVVAASIVLLALAACSSGGSGSGASDTAQQTSPGATTPHRPPGPAAELTALPHGSEAYLGEPAPSDLRATGYVQREYVAAGTATSYRAAGSLTHDGRWTFVPDGSAPYRTRLVVRAPARQGAFSGTVVVEWLNVSGGVDANPEWTSLHEEIERSGDAWVGVSAQRIGVEGGPVLVGVQGAGSGDQGKGLKAIDPDRYGDLSHPGDGFSFDIYTQVARALRTGHGLRGQRPQRLLAAGESQSAFALVTYFDGVQPLTRAFDGFFVHSRGAAGLPLAGPGASADIAGSIGGTPAIFRTDQDVPVLDVQTETDVASVLDSYAARQPDNEHFRLWEVAGTAHADAHLIGASARSVDCGVPINDGPMHVVAKAALHALDTWVGSGTPPVKAPRIEVAPGPAPVIVRDADGIAKGGIRTPPVDVPVDALSGAPGPNPSTICLLLGSTRPLSPARIAHEYSSRAQYLRRYRADTIATIKAGFALPADRAALLAFAEPSRVGS